jgi:hypothetical protein
MSTSDDRLAEEPRTVDVTAPHLHSYSVNDDGEMVDVHLLVWPLDPDPYMCFVRTDEQGWRELSSVLDPDGLPDLSHNDADGREAIVHAAVRASRCPPVPAGGSGVIGAADAGNA